MSWSEADLRGVFRMEIIVKSLETVLLQKEVKINGAIIKINGANCKYQPFLTTFRF